MRNARKVELAASSARTDVEARTEVVAAPSKKSRFDLDALRMNQDFDLPQKKVLATIPVRKPDGQEWVRTHPGEDYRLEVGLIFFKEDRNLYLVDRALHQALGADVKRKLLITTVTAQEVVLLWPLNLPVDVSRTATMTPRS